MAVSAIAGNILAEGVAFVSWTPAGVATATTAEQTLTVPGVRPGDFVNVAPPGITAGVAPVYARVTAANTVAVGFVNPTAGSVTPPAGVWQFNIVRPESQALASFAP